MRQILVGVVASIAVVALSACAAFKSESEVRCSTQSCALAIQNDAKFDLTAQYADTTGRRGPLGRVRAGSIVAFRVQRILSARVHVLVTTPDGDHYDALISMLRARTTEVHFPADFKLVEPQPAQ